MDLFKKTLTVVVVILIVGSLPKVFSWYIQKTDKNNITNNTSNSLNQEIDSQVKDSSKSSPNYSQYEDFKESFNQITENYFNEFENYGSSSLNNVCTDGLMSLTIQEFKQRGFTFLECQTSSLFPAKTFTIIGQSGAMSGYLCSDQNGFVGMITDLTSIKRGVLCK